MAIIVETNKETNKPQIDANELAHGFYNDVTILLKALPEELTSANRKNQELIDLLGEIMAERECLVILADQDLDKNPIFNSNLFSSRFKAQMLFKKVFCNYSDEIQSFLDKNFLSAVNEGDLIKLKVFDLLGADINALLERALFLAASMKHLDIVQYLLENYAAAVNTFHSFLPTNHSISNNLKILWENSGDNLNITKYLIPPEGVNAKDDTGNRALTWAASLGYEKTFEFLLSQGADINGEDDRGIRAWKLPVIHGHLNIVRYIFEKLGYKIYSELPKAAKYGHWPIVQYFIKVGGAHIIDQPDVDGNIALIAAAENNQKAVVDYLIKWGANIDIQNNEGHTALMKAVSKNQLEIVKYLVEHGANIKIRNENRDSAFTIKYYEGWGASFGETEEQKAHKEIIDYLNKAINL
jgi:ankyrin repeat protein